MLICKDCGAQLKDGLLFCTKCGSSDLQTITTDISNDNKNLFSQQVYYQNEGQNISSGNQFKYAAKEAAKSAGSAIMTGVQELKKGAEKRRQANAPLVFKKNLILAEGETIIRTYNVTNGSAPGTLTVTNKRIVFTASGYKSKAFMSVPIDSVGSIDIVTGRNKKQFIIGVVFCLFFFLVIPLIIGIILIKSSKELCLSISAQNSTPGLILGSGFAEGSATDSINGLPGADVNEIMAELGAMVLDLQQLGDYAIEKWQR